MSLFGLYKNHHNPSREVIEDSLTGNLCRCTGYQPIIKAAEHACSCVDVDKFTLHEARIIDLLKEINHDKTAIEIQLPYGNYYKPFLLSDALRFRQRYPQALVISGATDTALRQTKKHEKLTNIIDLSGITELDYFAEDDTYYRIGEGLSLERLKTLSTGKLPALHHMLQVFGSLQIRNLATIGGNIGSASPIGDTLPLLMAYKADVVLRSEFSERVVHISDFIEGYRKTSIAPGELITAVHIPKPAATVMIRSYKVSKRKDLDISTVSGGFSLALENELVQKIILAFGGMADMPRRASETEKFLTGKPWNRTNIDHALKILVNEFTPWSDARASAEYRSLVARNLLLKFYNETSTPGQ
jgi:xanthine dehydrogenase small subunit